MSEERETRERRVVRIGLVGDESPDVRAHRAIPKAIALAWGDEDAVELGWLLTLVIDDFLVDRAHLPLRASPRLSRLRPLKPTG